MHELSIMSNVLDIVVQHAQQNGAVKVTKIHLLIGELSDYIPEWMQNYFDFVSKDTIAENAQLVVEMVRHRYNVVIVALHLHLIKMTGNLVVRNVIRQM